MLTYVVLFCGVRNNMVILEAENAAMYIRGKKLIGNVTFEKHARIHVHDLFFTVRSTAPQTLICEIHRVYVKQKGSCYTYS